MVQMRIGEVDVLVETVPVAGTEPTSGLDAAGDRMLDALERAQATIVAIGLSTVDTIGKLALAATKPEKVEVEFGLGFSVKGNVIVASGQADATLKVKLVYHTAKDN
jgi:hypothetical protein